MRSAPALRQYSIRPFPARLLAVLLLIAAALVTRQPLAAASTPATAGSTGSVQQLCGTAAPGYARCLAERQVPAAGRMSAQATVTPAVPGGLGPADLADAYQLDTSKGYGQTVAVVDAYDDPTAAADLAVYRSQYGLPACAAGCLSKVNQAGASSPLPAANAGWAGEISLDLDMVSAVCPECGILLVEAASSSLADLGTAVDTAVRLGAKFVSNSYGGSEFSGVGGYDVHYDHPGVAITASTGDNGYGVSYPATSPYVTAVGGTTLSRGTGGRGWTETAWAGAGSGCSGYLAQPSVQAAAGTGCPRRAAADVSAVANPATGVAVYGTYGAGGWGVYGGTSASSPIIASVYALAGTPGATDYPNSYPYVNAGGLFDVTAGSNGSCPTRQWCAAGTGWDGPTGLGTPDTAAAFSATGAVSGTPARFGATARVSGPVVAGLPVTLVASPQVPDGDALASIGWKPARTDCVVADPAAAQTTVSCPAGLVGTTTVTVTVTDTQGASKAVAVPIGFASTAVKRPVAIGLAVAGQTGAGQSLCTGASTPVQAVVTDTATGLPVKGLTVAVTRKLGTAAASGVGAAVSAADGSATVRVVSTAAATLGAGSAAAGPYSAGTAPAVAVTVLRCAPSLAAAADRTAGYYGDPVTITGALTRQAGGGSVPLPGASVQVTETVTGRVIVLGTATSGTDGSVSAVVHPTASGTLGLALPAATGWTAASAAAGPLTVSIPGTTLTATADRLDVGYADPVVVSGTLTRNGAGDAPLARALVNVRSTAPNGAVSVLGTATVAADGSWTATVRPRAAGILSALYAGAAGQPAASAGVGALTVGAWSDSVTLVSQLSQFTAGAGTTVSGAVTRQYEGAGSVAPSVPVGIYLTTSQGTVQLLRTVTTGAAGTFSAVLTPLENGSLTARLVSVPGYANAASDPVPVSVASRVVASGPSVMTGGRAVPITVRLTVSRAAPVAVQELVGGSWVTVGTVTTSAAGQGVLSLAGLALGAHTYRASFGGDARGGASASASITVTIRS